MIALTLRLDDDVHEALRLEAFERRVPLNQIIRDRIACGSEPQGEPSDAQVEAAARVMFEPPSTTDENPEYTWAEMVREDPSRADIWRSDARAALRAAGVVRREGEKR